MNLQGIYTRTKIFSRVRFVVWLIISTGPFLLLEKRTEGKMNIYHILVLLLHAANFYLKLSIWIRTLVFSNFQHHLEDLNLKTFEISSFHHEFPFMLSFFSFLLYIISDSLHVKIRKQERISPKRNELSTFSGNIPSWIYHWRIIIITSNTVLKFLIFQFFEEVDFN